VRPGGRISWLVPLRIVQGFFGGFFDTPGILGDFLMFEARLRATMASLPQ
jgi:hypothetical protein